jgi:hypothetical protein
MAGGGAIQTGPVSPRALLEGGTAAGVWALGLGDSELAFRVKHFWGGGHRPGTLPHVLGTAGCRRGGHGLGKHRRAPLPAARGDG